MEIHNPAQTGANITLTTSTTAQKAWQVDQILKAVVVALQPGGGIKLRIEGAVLQAQTQTQLPVAPGDNLKLQVVKTGEPPVLRLVEPRAAPDPLAQALRTALPRQQSLTPLLANLALLGQRPQNLRASLPPQLIQLADRIFNNLPDDKAVSNPAGLRRALLNTGNFLENGLVRAQAAALTPNLGADFKAGLLRLLAALLGRGIGAPRSGGPPQTAPPSGAVSSPSSPVPATPSPPTQAAPPHSSPSAQAPTASSGTATPSSPVPNAPSPPPAQSPPPSSPATAPPPLRGAAPQPQAVMPASLADPRTPSGTGELLRQVEAGLARIQLSQLASLPTEDTRGPILMLELPVRHDEGTDLFQLRIGREPSGETEDGQPWSVMLAFDLEALGPVRALITVIGKEVSVGLWAERSGTTDLFNQHLNTLGERFHETGLTVGRIDCHCGMPPDATTTPRPEPLLNLKA